MIHEVSGDILFTKAQAIAHGIAPNDHFDNGLALALREWWPAMAKDFRHFAKEHHPKPGTMWACGASGSGSSTCSLRRANRCMAPRPAAPRCHTSTTASLSSGMSSRRARSRASPCRS